MLRTERESQWMPKGANPMIHDNNSSSGGWWTEEGQTTSRNFSAVTKCPASARPRQSRSRTRSAPVQRTYRKVSTKIRLAFQIIFDALHLQVVSFDSDWNEIYLGTFRRDNFSAICPNQGEFPNMSVDFKKTEKWERTRGNLVTAAVGGFRETEEKYGGKREKRENFVLCSWVRS